MFFGSSKRTGPAKRLNCVCLLDANQVVRALPPTQVPLADIYPKGLGIKAFIYTSYTISYLYIVFKNMWFV